VHLCSGIETAEGSAAVTPEYQVELYRRAHCASMQIILQLCLESWGLTARSVYVSIFLMCHKWPP